MRRRLTRSGSIFALALLGLLATAGVGYAATPGGIDGTWKGTVVSTVRGGSGTFTVTLTSNGNSFSGPISLPGAHCGSSGTVSGTLQGNQISFGVANTGGGGTFEGVLNGDSMSGTWSSPGTGDCLSDGGTWSGTRVTGGSCSGALTASLVLMSQATCNTLYGSDEKHAFRKLAKIVHDGLVVDQTIAGLIDKATKLKLFDDQGKLEEYLIGKAFDQTKTGKLFEKAFGKFFARFGFGGFITPLDAPEYAGYLDLAKYTILNRLADDPPDPGYKVLAAPPKLRSLKLKARRGVSKRRLREAASYYRHQGKEVALNIAMLTAVERADGARLAGDAAARSAQLRYASSIANKLVGLLRIDEKATASAVKSAKKLKRALRRRHLSMRLSRTALRVANRKLGSKSYSRYATKALTELGFTPGEIQAAAQTAPKFSLKRFRASFPGVLGLGAQLKAIRTERAMLATFANRHALGN